MKTKTLLIAAVMFLGLTAAAFAQATYSVGSIPVTTVISTGQVELTGDVTFSQVVNGNTSNLGTITVTYPVPITVGISGTNGVVGSGIRISTASGYALAAVNPPGDQLTVGILSVSNGQTTGQGQVVIQVPAGVAAGSFTLTGVRVAVAGNVLSNLNANISSTLNAITANQTNVTVISAIAAGIASVTTSTAGVINATTGAFTNPVIKVKEGFLNAFGDPATSTAAGIRITLSAAPPVGITLTFPAAAATDGAGTTVWQTMNSDGTIKNTNTVLTSASTTLTVYYRNVSGSDPIKQETLTINPTITPDLTKLPFASSSPTYTVSLAPIGTAFDSNNAVITTAALIPRYAAAEVGPATLWTTTNATTYLLFPFVQTIFASDYNTGFAIANTTEDPWTVSPKSTAPAPVTEPVLQSGPITFYFYPQLPTPTGTAPTNFSYTTTAGSPGTGLDGTGNVPAGSTYTVLLSELLQAAGYTGDFAGYVVAVTNFTNAHSLFNISNYAGFSQGAMGIVLGTGPVAGRGVPEGLNN